MGRAGTAAPRPARLPPARPAAVSAVLPSQTAMPHGSHGEIDSKELGQYFACHYFISISNGTLLQKLRVQFSLYPLGAGDLLFSLGKRNFITKSLVETHLQYVKMQVNF